MGLKKGGERKKTQNQMLQESIRKGNQKSI